MVSTPEEAVTAVFSDQAARLRAEFPKLYAHVDEILADPTRAITSENPPVFDAAWDAYHVRECEWCGEPYYVAQPTRPSATCSQGCSNSYRAWRRKRDS